MRMPMQRFQTRRIRWCPPSVLGQIPPGTQAAFSACDLIPTQHIPVIKDIVSKVGCSAPGQAAAVAALATIPGIGPYVSAFGGPFIIGCVCAGQKGPFTPPIDPPRESNLLLWGVLGAAAVGVAVLFARSRRESAPTSAPTPASPPKET